MLMNCVKASSSCVLKSRVSAAVSGSTDPGTHPVPIRTASTKAQRGRHPKSGWMTSEFWLLNPPDPPGGG